MSDLTNPDNNDQVISNPATQTLFRFVSLRNPQLAETENNLGFITRPGDAEGVFDSAIENWAAIDPKTTTKFQELEDVAADFEAVAFKNEKDVKGLNTDYFQLGKTLAKNEIPDQSILDKINNDTLKSEDIDLTALWDNLIYQVVTQKDFYVKEAIIQTLKAVHYVDKYKLAEADRLEEDTALAKTARVVLPAKLFVEDAPVEEDTDQNFTVGKTVVGSDDPIIGGGNAAKITKDSVPRTLSVMEESRLKVNAEKNLKVTNTLLKKDMLQTLKKELEKLQKSYSKAYYKAYNTAFATYQAEVQPIIESNNNLIEALEATFDENTTEAAKQAAYEQLNLAEVPKFEFTYKNEINFTDLQAKLTPESFNMFLELFTEYDSEAIANALTNRIPQNLTIISDTAMSIYDIDVTLSEDYFSYPEIFTKLDEEISEQSKTALSAVEMPKKQYVNLGGALVPVANDIVKTPQAYNLKASSEKSDFSKLNNLYFGFEVENDSWSVAYAKISADTNGQTIEQSFSNLQVVNDKITFPAALINQFEEIKSLRIELYFDNGREAVLEFDELVINQNYSGIFDFITTNASRISNTATMGSFQPKHFGVKRLGIADYLKVEQSIHAYVPGEVSNIENVMASELRHKSSVARDYSEITDTTSKSQETEKISDTTKTSRTDVQTEVAKELEKQQSWEANTRMSGKAWGWSVEVGGSYANSTAQHDSTRQAVAKSQEITERAMERVLTKVSEERVQKIIKEYTETNVHEFDNRGKAAAENSPLPAPPQHITGVYRWVDKKMKNQIYNYGKRTMFEFMIPEPARLHRLAIGTSKNNILTAPIDPRSQEAGVQQMTKNNVSDDLLNYWAAEYNVKLTELPQKDIIYSTNKEENLDNSDVSRFFNLHIPSNYKAYEAEINYAFYNRFKKNDAYFTFDNLKGNLITVLGWRRESWNSGTIVTKDITKLEGDYDQKYYGGNGTTNISLALAIKCSLSDTYMANWRQTNFDAIIAAYDVALKAFNDAQAAADAQAQEDADANKEKVSLYYRDMEAEVLKHNCIAYLLQDYGALGAKDLYGYDKTMQSFNVKFGDNLDAYTSLAKFMEQAMEWSVMDYTFYPYYWADSKNWQELYLSSDMDPLFRNFLQAGMARVIVTVKPGFEDAVNFFMTTGRIWNGGEVPVIGDPMYLSIVEELRQPTGKPQGNYWITRVPTALTILQAGSVGLVVDDALPIFKEDHPEECENPLELETKSAFGKPVDVRLEGSNLPTTLPNTVVRPI